MSNPVVLVYPALRPFHAKSYVDLHTNFNINLVKHTWPAMLTDFMSHPLLQPIRQANDLQMTHRDVLARNDGTAVTGLILAEDGHWRYCVDHSYFSGKATDFTFIADDPEPIATAILATVQTAAIDHQGRVFAMLASINSAAINSLDGNEIVRNVLHEVRHVLLACDSGVLRLFDAQSGFLVPVAHEGLPDEYRQYRLLPNESISGEVFSTERPVLLNGRPDIVAAHRVMRPESRSFMERSDIANALICVPVVAEGKCLGTLTALCFSPEGRFSPFDLAILQSLAAQIAIGYLRSQSYQEALSTSRRLEEAREALTLKNRDLDRAVTLHETLLRIFAAETGLAAQLSAVSELYSVEFRFESVLGLAYRTGGWCDADEASALTQNVEAADVTVGRFLFRAERNDHVLGPLFGTLAAFMALDFMRNLSRLDILNARKATWFDGLGARGADLRRTQFGFYPDRQILVIVTRLPESGAGMAAYRTQSAVQAALAGQNALVFQRGEEVVMLLSASGAAALERGLAAAERVAMQEGLAMGASDAQAGFEYLSISLSQAEDAAAAMARRGRAGVLRFGEMGVERLLSGRSRADILDFTRQILAPLTEPGHEPLLRTLAAYLGEARSAARAARVLGLHTNTLYQRLQRIEALTGRNLSDQADLTLLGLACQLGLDYDEAFLK